MEPTKHILFGPKLKGHFHTPFTKVLTSHFLSVHPETYVLLLVDAFLSVFAMAWRTAWRLPALSIIIIAWIWRLSRVFFSLSHGMRNRLKLSIAKNWATYLELADRLDVSRKTISQRIKLLKNKELILRVGSARKGYWKWM